MSWWTVANDAIQSLKKRPVRLLISDLRLPDMEGDALFAELIPVVGRIPVVIITAFGQIDQAVRLIKLGVNDYLTKPFAMESLLERIRFLLSVQKPFGAAESIEDAKRIFLVGTKSAEMTKVLSMLDRVKDFDSTLLLFGESGVGKELIAHHVHSQSKRAEKALVAVNIASIPAELFESELFGYEKGAFTGAVETRRGYLESASDGTVLLDEIGDLPLSIQVKLLRVIEERMFFRVGGREEIPFRARLICATHKNLEEMVEAGTFREDLYYRINVIPFTLPPLRNRTEDIVPIAQFYASQFSQSMEVGPFTISREGEHALLHHEFTGNVRELRNRMERAVALCRGQVLTNYDIFPEKFDEVETDGDAAEVPSLKEYLGNEEKVYILQTLEQSGWRIGDSADSLQISRKTLWEKMKRHNIHRMDPLNLNQ